MARPAPHKSLNIRSNRVTSTKPFAPVGKASRLHRDIDGVRFPGRAPFKKDATMIKLDLDLEEVQEYLASVSAESKVYIGCDSDVFKKNGKWYAEYVTVIVVHKDGKHGCKIFGKVEIEPVYLVGKNKQSLRLMNEVYKSSGMYLQLAEFIGEREVEIHLDLNPDERFDSNVVLSQAVGYVKGLCGITPKIKPDAFAASYAADRLIRVKSLAA